MSNRRILAIVVAVTVAIAAGVGLCSWFVTMGAEKGSPGFSPLAKFRPIWKRQLKQNMLSVMVADTTSVIPSCHACQLEQCRTVYTEALDECIQKFDSTIPLIVDNGKAVGSQIGSCTDSEVEKVVGPLIPSPRCDDALVSVAHTLRSSKDMRVFGPFLKRFPALEAAFEQDPSLLPKIQEVYGAVRQNEAGRVALMKKAIKSPLVQKAALESANVKADQDIKHVCTLGKGLSETYPSWDEAEQELIARFMVYSLASG